MNLEIETRVIGGLISIGEYKNLKVQEAMLLLTEDSFYHVHTRAIYNLIKSLYEQELQFDAVSIMGLIPDQQFEFYNHSLKEQYYTANMLNHDVDELCSLRTLRKQQLILLSTLQGSCAEVITKKALDHISNGIQTLTSTINSRVNNNLESVESMVDDWFSQPTDHNFIYLNNCPLPPVPNQSLITIAGRSGHGKTFFAMYVMNKLIEQLPGKQHIYFNLEMNKRVMLQRYASLLGYTGESERAIVKNALPELMAKNMFFVNLPLITIDEIETLCRYSSLQEPIGVVTVDYLGLIKSKTKSDRNDLTQSDIAKRLAALSIELNCVVIGLIQVNRDFKTRPVGDRVPLVSDSAESMGSVHSATWWLGIDQPQNDSSDLEFQDLFQVACRKNRNGSTFYHEFDFKNGQFFKRERKFSDYPRSSLAKPIDM